MNAILGFSDRLKSESFGPLGDRRYREYADVIHSSGHHLLDVISTILDIAKIESGHMPLKETAVAVPDTLDMCLSLVAERAHRGRVAVVADYGLGLPLSILLAWLHGGQFDIQSVPGVGTTVTIRFPAERTLSFPGRDRQATVAAL